MYAIDPVDLSELGSESSESGFSWKMSLQHSPTMFLLSWENAPLASFDLAQGCNMQMLPCVCCNDDPDYPGPRFPFSTSGINLEYDQQDHQHDLFECYPVFGFGESWRPWEESAASCHSSRLEPQCADQTGSRGWDHSSWSALCETPKDFFKSSCKRITCNSCNGSHARKNLFAHV